MDLFFVIFIVGLAFLNKNSWFDIIRQWGKVKFAEKNKSSLAKRTPPKPWNINNNAAFVKLWSRSEIFWKKWKEINEILCLMLQKRKFWIDEEVRTGRQPSRLCGYWQRFFSKRVCSFFFHSFKSKWQFNSIFFFFQKSKFNDRESLLLYHFFILQ